MRPVIRYQSQLLYRRSYKPNRNIRMPLQRLVVRGMNSRLPRLRQIRSPDSTGGGPQSNDLDLQE
jgi:hypothetical protein